MNKSKYKHIPRIVYHNWGTNAPDGKRMNGIDSLSLYPFDGIETECSMSWDISQMHWMKSLNDQQFAKRKKFTKNSISFDQKLFQSFAFIMTSMYYRTAFQIASSSNPKISGQISVCICVCEWVSECAWFISRHPFIVYGLLCWLAKS